MTKLWCSSWRESDTEHTHPLREWSRLPTTRPAGPHAPACCSSLPPPCPTSSFSVLMWSSPGAKKCFSNGFVCSKGRERTDSGQFTSRLWRIHLPFTDGGEDEDRASAQAGIAVTGCTSARDSFPSVLCSYGLGSLSAPAATDSACFSLALD